MQKIQIMSRVVVAKVPVMYIAGAFSGPSAEAVDLNIAAARKVGALVALKGWCPLIPHANTAGFDRIVPGIPYDFWIAATMEMLDRSDAVTFVPGWENSTGAKGEHARAESLAMPIYYETRHVPEAAAFMKGA